MPIHSETPTKNTLDKLRSIVRLEAKLADCIFDELEALVVKCSELDSSGPLWIHAVCLLGYAALRSGKVRAPRHRPAIFLLNNAAKLAHDESYAARWILGRVRLADAAGLAHKDPRRLALTNQAYELFAGVGEGKTKIPVLLPGTATEYSPRLLIDPDIRDFDSPVEKIYSPFRYRMATAAALVELRPEANNVLLAQAVANVDELQKLHPDAGAAQLNGMVSLASAFALRKPDKQEIPEMRFLDSNLFDQIDLCCRDYGLTERKAGEWRAATHAINVLNAESQSEMYAHFEGMSKALEGLFHAYYPRAMPDFATIDRVYPRAFHRVCGEDADYQEFLRLRLPGISALPPQKPQPRR